MTTIASLCNVARDTIAKNLQSATIEETVRLQGAPLELSATLRPNDDTITLSLSLSEIIARKTKEFSEKLMDGFIAAEINVRDNFYLSISKSGKITASGTSKENQERIEQFFKDNPEMARALKEIAALNALLAQKEANIAYEKERRQAEAILDPEEREKAIKQAQMNHLGRMTMVSELSGSLTMQDGMLHSAALDYVRS